MHGSLGDMTLLRFARKSSYGYFSALGMFIGHYLAWICAGIMGAGVALILKSSIGQLDPGEVAFQSLGIAGVIAVIIAGWTTSNPTIYRSGLAFQSLNHEWSRTRVTVIVGIATTIVACFPFVFTKLLGFVGIMGLMLAPIGDRIHAILVALPKEHHELRCRNHLGSLVVPGAVPGTKWHTPPVLPADSDLALCHAVVHRPGRFDGRKR